MGNVYSVIKVQAVPLSNNRLLMDSPLFAVIDYRERSSRVINLLFECGIIAFRTLYGDNLNLDIGTRIKKQRLKLKLTQKQLSKKLGITQINVSFYERNERIPPADILINLTNIFNVTSDYLLGISDEDNSNNDLIKVALNKTERRLTTEFRNLEKKYKQIVWGELMKSSKMQ